VFERLLRNGEAKKVYRVLEDLENEKKITQEIDLTNLTTACNTLTAYAISKALISIEGVESILLCPPSPPIDIQVISKKEFKDVNELIEYINDKVSENKVIAIYDDVERDYIIIE